MGAIILLTIITIALIWSAVAHHRRAARITNLRRCVDVSAQRTDAVRADTKRSADQAVADRFRQRHA